MKFCLNFLLLFFLFPATGISENPTFRQQSNIDITARLNDANHTLYASMRLQYINNSPDTLRSLFLHLWANAYKNNQTAFAKQLLKKGDYDFHFAEEKDRGGYSSIRFESGGRKLSWSYFREAEDIILLYPEAPLFPGDTTNITIEYTLVFPHARFSRLGHYNNAFYATQWYPKPAVYDRSGWNPMSYLHRGEFYSDFGNFHLTLTLPANYVVASTGILQNEEEKAFLHQQDYITRQQGPEVPDAPETPPPSSSTSKTLRFYQENVHDFAWFADKRFRVLIDSCELTTGEIIETYSFFTHQSDKWFSVNRYLAASVQYMSEKPGPYPWKQVTAVQGIHSGGANMEYPAVTLIGKKNSDADLKQVIVHEVIHNWFYGILASNERKEPWIDEGFATYYERRFFEEHPSDTTQQGSESGNIARWVQTIAGMNHQDTPYLWYMLKAARNLDQAPGLPAEELTGLNYYAMTYFKAAMAIRMLEQYLGKDTFDRTIRDFYNRWKFHHPKTADLREAFKASTPEDLSWFFDDFIDSDKKIDLELSSVKKQDQGYTLKILNRGQIIAPFPVTALKSGRPAATQWFEGFEGEGEIFFSHQTADAFSIDQEGLIPETRRNNNQLKVNTQRNFFELPQLKFFAGRNFLRENQVYWLPVAGYNANDGVMVGLGFYNYLFPVQSFDWFLMPKYSSRRDDLVGTARIYKELYPASSRLHSLGVGAKVKRYGLSTGRNNRHYTQLETSARVNFNTPLSSQRISTYLDFTHFLIRREKQGFSNGEPLIRSEQYYANRLSLVHKNQSTLYPYHFTFELLQAEKMVRASFTAGALFAVNSRKEGLHVRFFAGKFLHQPMNPAAPDFRLSLQGSTPARAAIYDPLFIGYEHPPGTLWGNQTHPSYGNFKYPTPLGLTWNWLTAVNLAFDLPRLPMRIYADAGTYHRAGKDIISTHQFPWVGGIQLILLDDILTINLPLLASADLQKIADLNRLDDFYKRITFSIDFERINPLEARRNLHLLLF